MGVPPCSRSASINPFIWAAVGGLIGLLAGRFSPAGTRTVAVENIAVSIFGAFLGGDFVASMLNGGVVNDTDFKAGSLGLAVAGAILALVLLRVMRAAVGPLRPGRKKPDRGR